MTIETINEVEREIERFKKRLAAAKERIGGDNYWRYSGSKETAALKRGAMDLKNELT